MLNPALYPKPGRERMASPAPGCPEFGKETLDLAYRLDGEWVVVDYKTEEEDPAATRRLRRQVGLYVTAVREAAGTAARGVVLFV